MKSQQHKLNPGTLAASIGLAFLCGCATPKQVSRADYFYPPPPNEPRLQFLTGFSSEKDFRGADDKTLMNFLTGTEPMNKEIGKPYGAAVSGKKLYVCDTALRAVLVLDLQTRHFGALEAQGEGALNLPLNVTADKDGTLYVTDTGREQVVIFDKDGKYLSALGKAGEMKPRDVAVNGDRIYVADLMKHDVRVFDKSTHQQTLEIPNQADRTNHTKGIFTPTNLALDSKGKIYVSDAGAFRVQVYDSEGNYVRSIGEMGDGQGQFARVKGIAIDHEDRLYAADAMSQVVQIFDAEGKLLTWFGEPGTDKNIQNLPAKVLVDYDDIAFFEKYAAPTFKVENLVVVINQLGAHKVSIYGFGERK